MLHDVDETWTSIDSVDSINDDSSNDQKDISTIDYGTKLYDIFSGFRFLKVLPHSNKLKMRISEKILNLFQDPLTNQNKYSYTYHIKNLMGLTTLSNDEQIELVINILDLFDLHQDEYLTQWIRDSYQFMNFLVNLK